MFQKKVVFRNIKIKNFVVKNVPYVIFTYESDFYFLDSEIYNAYPISIYSFFSNITIVNNTFSNFFNRNGTYQTSALYIEYSNNLNISKNNFSNLYSLSNAPVKFI